MKRNRYACDLCVFKLCVCVYVHLYLCTYTLIPYKKCPEKPLIKKEEINL